MLRWAREKDAALLNAVVGGSKAGCAAACCGGCKQKGLRCCMLRWAQVNEAALLLAVVGAAEGRKLRAALLRGWVQI